MKNALILAAILLLTPLLASAQNGSLPGQMQHETLNEYNIRTASQAQAALEQNAASNAPARPSRPNMVNRFPGLIPLALSSKKRAGWKRDKEAIRLRNEGERRQREARKRYR